MSTARRVRRTSNPRFTGDHREPEDTLAGKQKRQERAGFRFGTAFLAVFSSGLLFWFVQMKCNFTLQVERF